MNTPRTTRMASLVALLAFFAGCDAFSPSGHRPLKIFPFHGELPREERSIVVDLRSAVPGRPLEETVWDNASGPLWDVSASKAIDYARRRRVTESRIVIPFGRILTEKFRSALEGHFSRWALCTSDTCVRAETARLDPDDVLTVSVRRFKAWEEPRNHLNYAADVIYAVRAKREGGEVRGRRLHRDLAAYKAGGLFNTRGAFLKHLNQSANDFAEDIVQDVLRKGLKEEW
jgi:hypothetical protein